MHRRLLVGAALPAALILASPAAADRASLHRGPGPRPGPPVLYRGPAVAPQLENAGPWRAAPILVSGASAYRRGEFVHQDFLFDDHGARGRGRDADDPRKGDAFSPPNGTYTYPRGRAYADNLADLVEVRIRRTRRATLFRLTFNTMTDPERMAATVALGSGALRAVPAGANATAAARAWATWHGRVVDVGRGCQPGRYCDPFGTERRRAQVDRRRRQVTFSVPDRRWRPGRRERISVGVGLWDRARGGYLLPGATRTASRPGGAAGLRAPSAFFNVAFRSEPPPRIDASALSAPSFWRDRAQARALTRGWLGAHFARVDFDKLRRGVRDDSGVPRTGPLNRILPSAFADGQGAAFAATCGPGATRCLGQLRGRLQPYSLYVPRRRPLRGRYGLTLLLHSLTANYNQFTGSRNQEQFGERREPNLVITPAGRGYDGFYRDRAAADVFEVWADVARRYRLRPAATSITGYSMGGFGTLLLGGQFPDLFARAQPTVGALLADPGLLASFRHLPVRLWNHVDDELVDYALPRALAERLDRLGYRYELDSFRPPHVLPPTPVPNHTALAGNDEYGPAAAFLGAARVPRDPARVTYAYDRSLDAPGSGIRGGKAYWVSGVRPRRGERGTVDVRSLGFGRADAPSSARGGRGTLRGGRLGPVPFDVAARTWGRARPLRRADRLEVRAENVRALTVDARRARVSCRARIVVREGGPVRVRLAGCPAPRASRDG